MVTSLEELYWSLRNDAQNRIKSDTFDLFYFHTDLPSDADFSAPPLSALDHPWFFQFTSHPQISALLRFALDYLFLCCDDESGKLPNPALLEQVCNRCLEILETYYNTDDTAADAFRHFWALITLPPTTKSSERRLAGRDYYYKHMIRSLSAITGNEVAKKLDRMLKQDFIPLNEDFERVRVRYQNQLTSYYQKGFIYLLGEFDFNDFYIPPQLFLDAPKPDKRGRTLPSVERFIGERFIGDYRDIFQKSDIVYIIGVPGSGKSLFLRNLINHYDAMSYSDCERYLVIYCDMKTYYSNGESNQKSIPDFLQETIINTTGLDQSEISLAFIRYHLQLGRCLVLMDALDEVPKANRLVLHKKVVSYFKGCHPDNKMCITSRARGFLPQEQIEVLRIPKLTEQDISSYLDKMIALGKFKDSDKKTFLSQAAILIEKEFLTNFLILSLMVNIYKAERELPENKIELYKKCFEYIAKKREMEKGGKVSYDWDLLAPLMKESTFISLSILAAPNNQEISRESIEEMLLDQYRYKYADEAKTESAIRQFLDFCSSRTDLFVLGDSEETFRFFHRSFFEYFYSRYITQQPQVEKMYTLMSKFDEDSEVFELTLALVKEDNERKYQKLVEHIFARAEKEFQFSRPKYTAFKILTLSMQVIDDSYFRKKYLCLVMGYPELMSSPTILKMNQKPIITAVEKALLEFPDLVPQFRQVYESRYICFIMSSIGEIPPEILGHVLAEFRSPSQNLTLPVISYQTPPNQIGFDILVYPEQDALRDQVVRWSRRDFAQFRAALPPALGKNLDLLRGLEHFEQASQTDRQTLWDCFNRQRTLEYNASLSQDHFYSPQFIYNLIQDQ